MSESAAKPLPKAQLAALVLVRLIDPVSYTQMFPYINQFMAELQVTDDPAKVGFYSGLVESAFSLSQLVSIYQWGRISDAVGRRPAVLAGALGIAASSVMFGFSGSLTTVLLTRCLGGLSSGNIAVVNSAVAEITNSANQAIVIPIYGLSWPIGSTIGPLIGGTFAHAATRYPRCFGWGFFEEHPYFLPCAISAMLALAGVAMGVTFIEETLPGKRSTPPERDSTTSPGAPAVGSPGIKQLLSLPVLRTVALSGYALSFLAMSFEVLFVLFCYTPVHSGGLAFSSAQIGYFLAAAGLVAVLCQVLVAPYLLRRFECAKIYYVCMRIWPVIFAAFPLLNLIARWGMDAGTGALSASTTAVLWTGIGTLLVLSRTGAVASSLSVLLVKQNAPQSSLGQSNGIVQFAMCLGRTIGPFFASSVFALSIKSEFLGGFAWVGVMMLVSMLGARVSRGVCAGHQSAGL
ncbi:hypothetical protein HYDPIDRAFT_99245 [Hydnomerulius pinastri MD-312]|uniref:Major facilitator superfamily (MFS) profile domain-containing protein n=1 Tax=Hydnomerulius pinastri MD-312 TaxID=994086 RepID=A0A0C9WAM6_9AGAM|nr:hypothetical protein HYDPIDRAFT_99245 [Hydnomerulius pinastri MD-312]